MPLLASPIILFIEWEFEFNIFNSFDSESSLHFEKLFLILLFIKEESHMLFSSTSETFLGVKNGVKSGLK